MVKSADKRSTINAAYLKDYDCSVRVNRWFLQSIGAWPKLASTSTKRILEKLLILVCHSLLIFTFAPCFLYILFEDTSLEARMKAIGPMSHWLMGELNYCCLLTRSKDILHCLECIESDWRIVARTSNRELMLRNAKVGRFIACIAALCMQLGIFSYVVITGFQKAVLRVGNESHSMYRLPCPFYTKLIDTRYSPANEIVFVLQLVSALVSSSVTAGACGLAAVLAMHACGQLSTLMCRLKDMMDRTEEQLRKEEERITQKRLASIVEHHLRALSFVSYIEKVMNLICLTELVGCTLNMCMLEYYFLTEKSKETLVIYAIVYTSMIFNIFIFCYIGEKLTEQCKRVGEQAYMTKWYGLPHKTAAGLILVISRSSMATKITAGKMVHVSIATFGDVFKTSFAYFNMLRTVAT